MLPRYPVLNTWISTGTPTAMVDTILKLGAARTSSYVCFANVHMVVEAYRQPSFSAIVNRAAVVAPDGSPVAAAVRWFGGPRQPRVAGMDTLPMLLAEAARRGQSVYFYGTTDKVLQAIEDRIRQDLPALRIAGMYSPPFRPLTPAEDEADVARINEANPDLVFVALGCPRQEQWMAQHQGRVKACMLGVGQAFLTYAGLERRLPEWARKLWLEWAYRLYLEPRRLWRRYLVTNSRFVWLVSKKAVQHLSGRPAEPAPW
ncbi:WecB/TagA/CpsF family glycosyltransferase [Hymenobacter latericus]|uniref:WecB/TagA/CpsF family glycosyltransferase n=1 Tax=Hymenobacter sp. YIM 151858-1 TaxID=2987688 RepID=UPI002227A26A|nr:WecB/TagA/CpsF family glycosyltransferase [Hymenobacter sp. YIM 151858-1]UYZ60815.1 WecB/TagA/CpsF family glycosyltransferase [Hymenobacter sp. YIM 151858-1]